MKKVWIHCITIYLICLIIEWIIYGRYMYDPNQIVFTFGGDGYILYYNMIYHTLFGNGIVLESMNFPGGELSFLTDMQASLSILLNQIHTHIVPLNDHVIGIVHALLLYLLPISAIFLYLIFKNLRIHDVLAIIFSILITFLSPQIIRITSHFGLGYLFLLPMCIWWILFQMNKRRMWYSSIPLILILLFFALNNPYIGFMTCALLILSGIIIWIVQKRTVEKNYHIASLNLIVSGLTPLLVSFLVIKFFDPFTDRIEIQWGYFYFQTKLGTLFFPPGSLLFDWLSNLFTLRSLDSEQAVNIGLAATLILLIAIISALFWKKKSILRLPTPLIICLIAGGCLLLYSMGFPFFPIIKPWTEEHLSMLLMFKATSRFAWPMYYVLTIIAVYYLNQYFTYEQQRGYKKSRLALLLLIASIWSFEAYQHSSQSVQGKFYSSPFRQTEFDHLLRILDGNKINRDEYQGIFLVPLVQGWSDKLYSNLDFSAHFHGIRMSLATGLPLINAMLSRIPLSRSIALTQLVSHPLIQKKLLTELDQNRKILVLRGGESILKLGEAALLEKAKPLYQSKEFSLYEISIPVSDWDEETRLAQALYQQNQSNPNHEPVFYSGYNNLQVENSFWGKGALRINSGLLTLEEFDFNRSTLPDSLEFSVWVKLDHHKYGLPFWHVIQRDHTNQVIDNQVIETRYSHDIQHGWIRASQMIKIKAGTTKILIEANSNQEFLIDELMFRIPEDTILLDDPTSPYFSFNNYLVSKIE